ncbi:MAG: hypothetical protein NC548_11035 [Lachnospiraceae bacterium]|nr:hypothetical protein [Lachnospiraceae bacterium]
MWSTQVKFYNDNVVAVCKSGAPLVLVVKVDDMVVITQPLSMYRNGQINEPFVALVKQLPDTSAAYKEWMYLVGKMCKKRDDSKYFKNPKFEEHFKNGDSVSAMRRTRILKAIADAYGLVHEEN